MAEIPSPPRETEEQAEARMRMALAELGWEDVFLKPFWIDDPGYWDFYWGGGSDVPSAVLYMAGHLTWPPGFLPCWSCWWFYAGWDTHKLCLKGQCQHPQGPSLPPRDLLISRRYVLSEVARG